MARQSVYEVIAVELDRTLRELRAGWHLSRSYLQRETGPTTSTRTIVYWYVRDNDGRDTGVFTLIIDSLSLHMACQDTYGMWWFHDVNLAEDGSLEQASRFMCDHKVR